MAWHTLSPPLKVEGRLSPVVWERKKMRPMTAIMGRNLRDIIML
jgi:hypothetical protein